MKLPDNILKQKEDAYNQADAIDGVINDLVHERDIKINPYFWLTFCRTVKTGLNIIEAIAMEEIKK